MCVPTAWIQQTKMEQKMEMLRKAQSIILEWNQGERIPEDVRASTDSEGYREEIQHLRPLLQDKVNIETSRKELVGFLKEAFICVATLFIFYVFTYISLDVFIRPLQ